MNYYLSLLGTTMSLSLVNKMSTTMSNVYTLVCSLSKQPSQVTELLHKSDIVNTIKVIEQYVKDLQSSDMFHSRTMTLCLESLNEVILQIKNELDRIQFKMKYNEKIWFLSSVRKYNFRSSCERLADAIDVLNLRRKLLFEITSSIPSLEHPKVKHVV